MTSPSRGALRVHVGPDAAPPLVEAVHRGGGSVVAAAAAEMFVWDNFDPETLRPLLHDAVRWVQLPSAGVEGWLASGMVDSSRTWMSAAGASAEVVADHALALILAGRRRLTEAARASSWDPSLRGRPLRGARVAIVGAGAIGRALIRMLEPHGVEVTAVTRGGAQVQGAARSLPATAVEQVWREAEVVVLAAPATAETNRLIDADVLARMRPDAWLVNVARGSIVDHEALAEALAAGEIAGAALDLTDPEPLPDGHPLWREPRALLTPHVANPPAEWLVGLAVRVRENVERIGSGHEPLEVLDPGRGY